MGKVSVKENKSIYQVTREGLGYSRAEAAEKTGPYGLTEYRLVKLEDGTSSMQPADVLAMARGYRAPDLCNHYCSHECPIGREYVPEIEFRDNVHEILVNMMVALDNVDRKKNRLMEILADGCIQADEEQDFHSIQRELERIAMTVDALQLWCEKMQLLSDKPQ